MSRAPLWTPPAFILPPAAPALPVAPAPVLVPPEAPPAAPLPPALPALLAVPRSLYASFRGTLEGRVDAFLAARAAHAVTVDVPAPVEAPLVEAIARFGGMARVVLQDDLAPPETSPPPESRA